MNSYMTVRYGQEEIADYIVEILSLGLCSLFLPAGFVEEAGVRTCSYKTEGYRPLSSVSSLPTEAILSVAISLLHGAYECEKHCIFSEDFTTEMDCIFVDQGFNRIKMIYRKKAEDTGFSKDLAALLMALSEKGTAAGKGYIENAAEFLVSDEYGYKAQLHHLENLRREVYLCGVE